MSVLSDNYKRIIAEIEKNVSNQEELEFVKEKFLELSTLFMNVIDDLAEKTDKKIQRIEEKQKQIETKISLVEGAVDDIENDIYDEEASIEDMEDFEFEIVCPYCNYEFIADIDNKNEITCPECHNIIELDWNEEENEDATNGCIGSCSSCGGCANEFEKQDYNEDDEDM